MKKLIALITIATIALFSFAGCGNVGDAAKEAGELVTDASESMKQAADSMMNNSDGDISDDTSNNGNISQN